MPSDIQSVLGEPLAPETHQAISGDPGDYQAFLNADARGGALSGKESLTIDEAAYTLVRGDPGWSAAMR